MTTERKCRKCGCTSSDCRGCIERTGQPCWWIGADLCSACVPRLEAIGRLLNHVTGQALEASRGLAAVIVLIDRDTTGHLGSSSVGSDGAVIMDALRAQVVRSFGVVDMPGVPQVSAVSVPEPRPTDRAACIHCRQDVCIASDVEAIKGHSMTCPASPVVKELAAAKIRIAQLEAELGDVSYERTELQLSLERAGNRV